MDVLVFLDGDFKAMAVRECHRKLLKVSRDKKGEPLSEAPLFLKETFLVRSEDVVIGVNVGAGNRDCRATYSHQGCTLLEVGERI